MGVNSAKQASSERALSSGLCVTEIIYRLVTAMSTGPVRPGLPVTKADGPGHPIEHLPVLLTVRSSDWNGERTLSNDR